MSQDWIPIIEVSRETGKFGESDIFGFCALVENNPSVVSLNLQSDEWRFSPTSFGKSEYYREYKNGKDNVIFTGGTHYESFEYLVAYRTFNDKYKPSIEINPKLIWYSNLVLTGSEYRDPITDEPKIKIDNQKILVSTSYLRDFLAAYNQICILAFDHRRYFNFDKPLKGLKEVTDDTYKYSLQLISKKDHLNENQYHCSSIIFGKTLVLPFIKINHVDYIELVSDKEYESFIIKIDEQSGNLIEFTCEENHLANYFGRNPDAPHFLTPVFFNRKVLDRYKNDPKNFRVTDGYIQFLDKWNLPFCINEDDKVMVWLGDLGRIPHTEQKYWKTENISPSGGIEPSFFKRQMLAQFTEVSSPEHRLLNLISIVNQKVCAKFHQALFMDFTQADIELPSTFSLPTNRSTTAYQTFLIKLTKLTIERINTNLFVTCMPTHHLVNQVSGNRLGSIVQLDEFLTGILGYQDKSLVVILKHLQALRSSLAAHRGSIKKYNKIWNRSDDYEPDFILDSKFVLTEINQALNKLLDFLELGGYEND